MYRLFNVIFVVVVGGLLANSLAIINDALHQIFDLNSLLMSLGASWIARWKPNEKKTFGYYRAGKCFILTFIFELSSSFMYKNLVLSTEFVNVN